MIVVNEVYVHKEKGLIVIVRKIKKGQVTLERMNDGAEASCSIKLLYKLYEGPL